MIVKNVKYEHLKIKNKYSIIRITNFLDPNFSKTLGLVKLQN